MDSSADPANDAAPRKAAEWLVALGERPDDRALRARLEAWLAAAPENRRDWDEINRTWISLGLLEPEPVRLFGSAPARVGRLPLWRRRSFVVACAASVASILAVAWGPAVILRLESDHVTGTAELRVLKLDDGSDVSLGPLTALDVAYSGDERRIRLRQGEAFFVVAPGDRRPFVVETRTIEARDIGTAFDVKAAPEATEVAVQEGLVEVLPSNGAPAERLRAGESVRIDGSGGRQRQQRDPAQIAAWRNRQLVVDNQPVEAVVNAIRPFYPGAIIVRGGRLAQLPLTGVYNLADPVAALRAVAIAQDAGFHRLSPWLLVLSGD